MAKLTDDEVLQLLAKAKADREREIAEARANIEKYGTPLAPIGGAGPRKTAKVPEVRRMAGTRAKRPENWFDPKWNSMKRVCPHCKKEKVIGTDFGVTLRRGIEASQPWCKQCRAGTNYRKLERKNKPPDAESATPKKPKMPKK